MHVDEHREHYHWLINLDTTSPRWYYCLGVAWDLLTNNLQSRAAVEDAPFEVTVPDLASWIRDEYQDLDEVEPLDLRAIAHLGVRLQGWSWPEALLKSMTPELVGPTECPVSWSGFKGGPSWYMADMTDQPRLIAEDGTIITLSKSGKLRTIPPAWNRSLLNLGEVEASDGSQLDEVGALPSIIEQLETGTLPNDALMELLDVGLDLDGDLLTLEGFALYLNPGGTNLAGEWIHTLASDEDRWFECIHVARDVREVWRKRPDWPDAPLQCLTLWVYLFHEDPVYATPSKEGREQVLKLMMSAPASEAVTS